MNTKRTLALIAGTFLLPSSLPGSEPPDWWSEYGVTNQETANNHGPASLGQLKWTAWCMWHAMEQKLPGGAGFRLDSVVPEKPATADAAWYEAQKKIANLGQIKHVAGPFYERLSLIAPDWVATEFVRNDLVAWPHPLPWDPATPVAQNYSPANIGQLKLVFSLRLGESHDGDSIPDLLEHVFYGDTAGDGTSTDQDGDGLTDAVEIAAGTSIWNPDTDGDGIPDDPDPNPLVPESPTSAASELIVWTPLEN